MKTPEEIKKAFECCSQMYGCRECPYGRERCTVELATDTLAYIQQLEDQIASFGKMATMKEVVEYGRSIGLNFYYGEDEDENA